MRAPDSNTTQSALPPPKRPSSGTATPRQQAHAHSPSKEETLAHHRTALLKEAATIPKWRPLALLPTGFTLINSLALAAEETPIALPTVEVQGSPDDSQADKGWGYRAANSAAGTKTDTPLLETPQSISVVTREQMEAQNTRTLAETLRYTPGVQSEPLGFEPRMTFLKLRGFDATTSGLYMDGLKIANPGFFVGHSLEPYGAERVEVPRGPVSVLYGQASPGGLVNYVSKRPVFETFGEVAFQAGNYDRLHRRAL